jgi:hypothetical protein
MKIFNRNSCKNAWLVWRNRKPLVIGSIGLIAYTLFIQVGTDQRRGDPYYPLSQWNLFSGTLGLVSRFEVEIIELEGRLLKPPVPLAKLGILRRNAGGPPGLYQLLGDWGRALKREEIEKSESLRAMFERSFLPPGNIKYQLVRRQYVPVARLSSSSAEERVVIGEYHRD